MSIILIKKEKKMKNLLKLFKSFDRSGNIYLNRDMEVCFEIEYKKLEWNWGKVNYDDIEGFNINEAPKTWTILKTHKHFNFFRYDEDAMNFKVLEWLSRPAIREENDQVRSWYLKGINNFLGTNFTEEDVETVYCYLGNGINRTLAIEFVNGKYDLKILKEKKDV
jgi:hypothetical protein